jgi:rod shape-determining protein MreB
MEISGSNSITGLPESIILLSSELIEPLRQSVNELISAVKNVLQNTPPELAADVIDKGIIMSGGGAKLSGLEDLLTKITGVPCQVALEPELCAVKGTGIAIENFDAYKKSIFWVK